MPNMRRGLLAAGCVLLGASFFSAYAQAPPAIRVSDNHRFFVTQNGTPFFYLADTEWAMFHMTGRYRCLFEGSRGKEVQCHSSGRR